MGFLPQGVIERDRLKAYLVYFCFLAGFLGLTAYVIADAVQRRESEPPTSFSVKKKTYTLPYIIVCQIAEDGAPGSWITEEKLFLNRTTKANFTMALVDSSGAAAGDHKITLPSSEMFSLDAGHTFCDFTTLSTTKTDASGNTPSKSANTQVRTDCGFEHVQFSKSAIPDEFDDGLSDATFSILYSEDPNDSSKYLEDMDENGNYLSEPRSQDGICNNAFNVYNIWADPDCHPAYTTTVDCPVTDWASITLAHMKANVNCFALKTRDGVCPPNGIYENDDTGDFEIYDVDCLSDFYCDSNLEFDVDCDQQCIVFNTVQTAVIKNQRSTRLDIGGVFIPPQESDNYCKSDFDYATASTTNCSRNAPIALKMYVSHSKLQTDFATESSFNIGYNNIASTVFLARSEFKPLSGSTEIAYDGSSVQVYMPQVDSDSCCGGGACTCDSDCDENTQESELTLNLNSKTYLASKYTAGSGCTTPLTKDAEGSPLSNLCLPDITTAPTVQAKCTEEIPPEYFGLSSEDDEEMRLQIFYAQIRIPSTDVNVMEETDPVNAALFGSITGFYNMIGVGFAMLFIAKGGHANQYFRFQTPPTEKDLEDERKRFLDAEEKRKSRSASRAASPKAQAQVNNVSSPSATDDLELTSQV